MALIRPGHEPVDTGERAAPAKCRRGGGARESRDAVTIVCASLRGAARAARRARNYYCACAAIVLNRRTLEVLSADDDARLYIIFDINYIK